MTPYKILKVASAKITSLANELGKLQAKLAAAEKAKLASDKAVADAKLAADKAVKVAEAKLAAANAVSPEVAKQAKLAADRLLSAGLISTQEKADEFAAAIAGGHLTALEQLAKTASHVTVPRQARVVAGGGGQEKTANDLWDERLANLANTGRFTR